MCNLNIFVKTDIDKKDLNDYVSLINTATHNSFINNNDGDGVYYSGSDTLIKSCNKIHHFLYLEDIKNSKFILTHQRLSTSGYTDEFIQPFSNDDFILIHNGILHSLGTKNISDTYVFFHRFYKTFLKAKGTREKRIIEGLEILNSLDGSFSIGLYDKRTEIFYYTKDSGTYINFYRDKTKENLFITTNNSNDELYKVIYKDYKEIEIKDYWIYRISFNQKNKIVLRALKKLKSYYIVSSTNNTDFNDNWDMWDKQESKKSKKRLKALKKRKKHKSNFNNKNAYLSDYRNTRDYLDDDYVNSLNNLDYDLPKIRVFKDGRETTNKRLKYLSR